MKTKKILLIVDYQKDFVTGSLGFEDAKKLDRGISEKAMEYMNNNDFIVYTLDTHKEDYLSTVEGKNLPVEHCIKGTEGHDLYGETAVTINAIKKNFNYQYISGIEKETFGSIRLGTALSELVSLKALDEVTVEIVGVVTNICVISNAIICKAALPNARIIINSNLCASNDKEMEQKAYEIMRNLHMEVI